MLANIRWIDLITNACSTAERIFGIKTGIDKNIVDEVAAYIEETLGQIDIPQPNPAKVAGHIVFWIRKLKPVSHLKDSPNKFLAINEWVAVMVGLGVCRLYHDDKMMDQQDRDKQMRVHARLLNDLIGSLRVHSHSPSSTAIIFESLFTER